MSKQPFVLYVADAYCGWCFGFGPRLEEFEAANRDRVEFRVISGGLFLGERAQRISQYPHIPEANARIARLTGVRFGPAYNAVLEQGAFVMDSAAAAAGLAALRAQDERRGVEFFHQIQQAFYVDGRSLSDPDTYARIATTSGLDPDRAKADAGLRRSCEAGPGRLRDGAHVGGNDLPRPFWSLTGTMSAACQQLAQRWRL